MSELPTRKLLTRKLLNSYGHGMFEDRKSVNLDSVVISMSQRRRRRK